PPRRGHPADRRQALPVALPDPLGTGLTPVPRACAKHPSELCRLTVVVDRTMVPTARRLSSDGQSNALVMRRSRVRIPKAAQTEARSLVRDLASCVAPDRREPGGGREPLEGAMRHGPAREETDPQGRAADPGSRAPRARTCDPPANLPVILCNP